MDFGPLEKISKNVDFSLWGKQRIVPRNWIFSRVVAHCARPHGIKKVSTSYTFCENYDGKKWTCWKVDFKKRSTCTWHTYAHYVLVFDVKNCLEWWMCMFCTHFRICHSFFGWLLKYRWYWQVHYVWFSWFWSHLKMSKNIPMWLHDYLKG